MSQGSCQRCQSLAAGEDEGVCFDHGVLRLKDSELRKVLEEAERRGRSELKRYMIQSYEPRVETIPEEISEKSYLRIQSMKEQLSLRSFDQVVDYLTKEMAFRYDPSRALETRRPLIVVGPPESGKTRMVKSILRNFEKVFVVDVSHEYNDYETVNTGDVLGNAWATKDRFRIFPSDNPLYSDLEMSMTFGILLGKMKEPDSPMKDFAFVIEDAVRFTNVQPVRSFIAESRKFIRKCFVVCQDPKAFDGMGEILKP